MRLAFDTVPRCLVEAAVAAGHELTIWRDHEEPLYRWLTRVYLSQADGIVSATRHVGRHAYRMGLYWIRVPGTLRAWDQVVPTLANIERAARREAQVTSALPELPAPG